MAIAPTGGMRINGKDYPSGTPLPDKYAKDEDRLRDPAHGNPDLAPNMGRFNVPHIITFSGIMTSLAKAYRFSDQALRHSVENAHAMMQDPVIAGPLQARQCMTALLNWSIAPEDEDDEQLKRVSKQLTKIVSRTPRFTELRRWLMEATWYGRVASQHAIGFHRDRFGARTRVITRWKPVSGDKLLFRYDDGSYEFDPEQIGVRTTIALGKEDKLAGRRDIEFTAEGPGYFLKPWERKQWCVHKHMIRDGEFEDPISGGQIHGVGLRHFLYWIWYQKQEALSQIAEIIDRTGMGITIYYYPSGNMQAREEMAKVAREQAHTNSILIPWEEGMGDPIQQLPPNTAGLQVLHDIVEAFFGDMIVRFILGQTLSTKPTGTGMNSGVADLQKDSLFQIVQYDAVNLEESITKELVLPLRDLNFPKFRNAEFFFKISTKVSAPESELQALNQAWQMGAKIRVKDIFDKLDLAMADEGEDVVFNPQVVQAITQVKQAEENPGMMMGQPGMMGPGGQPGMPPMGGLAGGAGGAGAMNGPAGGMDQGAPDQDQDSGGPPDQMDKLESPEDERQRLFGPIMYSRSGQALRELIEQAASETDQHPSEDQKKSGNYRKGRVWIRGLEIVIESPKGTVRHEGWSPMATHYGYIARHSDEGSVASPVSKDDDKIDCYLGPDPDSEIVFVIDQVREDGKWDEHKVVIGCHSMRQARELYLSNYPKGWRVGPITGLTWEQFRGWIEQGNTKKPIEGQPIRYGKQMAFTFDEDQHPRATEAVTIKGDEFKAGEFIPNDTAQKATPKQQEKIEVVEKPEDEPKPEKAPEGSKATTFRWLGKKIAEQQQSPWDEGYKHWVDKAKKIAGAKNTDDVLRGLVNFPSMFEDAKSNKQWQKMAAELLEDMKGRHFVDDLPKVKPADKPAESKSPSKDTGPAGLTKQEAFQKAAQNTPEGKLIPHEQMVAATHLYLGTKSEDWTAVPIKGMATVPNDKGNNVSLPEFDFPQDYTQVETPHASGAMNPCCQLCGHDIKTAYHIQNDDKKWTMVVGSECVTHFSEKSGHQLAKDAQWKVNRDFLKEAWDAWETLGSKFGAVNHRTGGHYISRHGNEVYWRMLGNLGVKRESDVPKEKQKELRDKAKQIEGLYLKLKDALHTTKDAPIHHEGKSVTRQIWVGGSHGGHRDVKDNYEASSNAVISRWVKDKGDKVREVLSEIDKLGSDEPQKYAKPKPKLRIQYVMGSLPIQTPVAT